MPTTPPPDNKQEPVEYATDPVGPYNDKESKEFRKRLREFVCANDIGEKTKAFNAAYNALCALISVHPELIKMPDMVSVDERKIGESVEEPSTTTWLDKATESSPAAKLLRKLAREKNKVGDVVRVYAPEDWIKAHLAKFSR